MADTSGLDVAIAPNSSVILEPAESLTFHLQPQAAPQAVLTIRNVSDERKIAFKVKTTRPLRYLVRPNQGMLGPNGSASIMVILQQRDCDELLRLEPSERQLSNDKFLVQSIYADDSFYELVKTKSTKEMADDLTNMWAHTDKRSLSNKKLRCRFVQDDPSAAVTSAAAPGNNINNTESPLSSRFPSKSSIYSSSNSLLPTKQVSLEESSPVRPNVDAADVSTPAQLTAALLQETEKTTLKTGDATPTKDEIVALRKKYDELVSFTLLQKASSDAQRAKKINEDVSGSTLRQRKTGATAGNGGNSSDATQLSTAKGPNDPTAFGLFHLLVCAIIFFLVGRYC
uniref:MSP domain-containing protein n=1 Tax=Globisporangium ultimum (strain ATCC 200006 / CBS 805.95 / DAOM BR144) TaxID=431595 RepID=K3WTW9_GLOUD